MNIGMLWFDNDPESSLSAKVERCVTYYRTKYGRTPTLCFVHPSMILASVPFELQESPDGKVYVLENVEIRSNHSVLPNHFWIGR